MSITWCKGDILQDNARVLVIPVNCQGIAEAGTASVFKKAFPYWYEAYRGDSRGGKLTPGGVHHYWDYYTCQDIISLVTKKEWRKPAKVEWVDSALQCLRSWINAKSWPVWLHGGGVKKSVAIADLGCSKDNLPWADVRPLIERHLDIEDADIRVYLPRGAK